MSTEFEQVYHALIRRGFDPDAVHDAMVGILARLAKGGTIRNLGHYARQAAFFAFLREKQQKASGRLLSTPVSLPDQEALVALSEVPFDIVVSIGRQTRGQQSRHRRWRQKTFSQGGGR